MADHSWADDKTGVACTAYANYKIKIGFGPQGTWLPKSKQFLIAMRVGVETREEAVHRYESKIRFLLDSLPKDDLNSTTSKRVRLGIEARELLKEVMKLQGKLNMLDAQLLLDAGLANAELEHGEPSRETVKGRAPVAGTGWGRGRGSMVPGYLSPHLERLVSGEAAHSQSSAPHWIHTGNKREIPGA